MRLYQAPLERSKLRDTGTNIQADCLEKVEHCYKWHVHTGTRKIAAKINRLCLTWFCKHHLHDVIDAALVKTPPDNWYSGRRSLPLTMLIVVTVSTTSVVLPVSRCLKQHLVL